ncbi:YadA-like family protein [Lonepinella sp. BR2474]|uniref:YadA-like family protein n=1 Tax=Lonepinella sp. BR2474 TaxID=3434548 RepID=UPI003F6E2A6E
MNQVFKVIWNAATGSWVAVSELSKAHGKTKSKTNKLAKVLGLSAIGAAVIGASGAALASEQYTLDTGTVPNGSEAIAIGKNSAVNSQDGAASSAVAIGNGATTGTLGQSAVAVGNNAFAGGSGGVAIGDGANAVNSNTIAIGGGATASYDQSIAIGINATTTDTHSTAIGTSAESDKQATAVGWGSTANTTNAVATGFNSAATGVGATATGAVSQATQQGATATGTSSSATGYASTATGLASKASGESSSAYGTNSSASGRWATAIGPASNATATSAMAMGQSSYANATNATAIGRGANATATDAQAFGTGSTANATNATAIGTGATATDAGSVVLGNGSAAAKTVHEENATIANVDFLNFAGAVANNSGQYVSIGSVGNERQLKNVGAGEVTANSTDAINGSQLYSVTDTLLNLGWTLQENGTDVDDTVKSSDTVNFVNGTGTTATSNKVHYELDDGTQVQKSEISYNVNTDNKTVTVNSDGDVQVITANVSLNTTAGNGTVAVANTYTDSKGNDVVATDTVEVDGKTYKTSDVTNGVVNDGATALTVGTGDSLVNASTVASAINAAYHSVNATKTTETVTQGGTAQAINAGDTVNYVAGKNMITNVSVEANGVTNVTVATVDNPKFENVTIGDVFLDHTSSGLKVSNLVTGDDDEVTAEKATITGVTSNLSNYTTSGNETTSSAAGDLVDLDSADGSNVVTVDDLKNLGWVVSTSDNDYTQAVTNAQEVDFVAGSGVTVKGETTDEGVYQVKIALSDAGNILPAGGKAASDDELATGTTTGKVGVAENPTGFVSAKNVADAINSAYHSVDVAGTDETFEQGESNAQKINAGDTVTYVAGKNLVSKIDTETTEGVTNVTYALSDDIEVNSVVVGKPTYEDEKGNVYDLTQDEDGNYSYTVNGVTYPVDAKDVTEPVVIVENAITGLNSTLPVTNSTAKSDTDNPNTVSQKAPTEVDETKAATVGDVLNAGWNLQENGGAKDFVKAYDTVNFVNGTGTVANVSMNDDNTIANVTFNVKADNSTIAVNSDGALEVVTATVALDSEANNGKVAVEPSTSYKDSTGAEVKPADTVVVDGKTYKASDVTNGVVNADATALTAIDNGAALVNASTVADAINMAYHSVDVAGNDETFEQGASNAQKINAGDTVTYVAGKNLVSKIDTETTEGVTNVTYALSDDIDVNSVTIGNTKISANVVEDKDGKKVQNGLNLSTGGEAAKLTGVAAGDISATSTDAINGSQLYALTSGYEVLDSNGNVVEKIAADDSVKYANGNGTTANVIANVTKNDDGTETVNGVDVSFDVNTDNTTITTKTVPVLGSDGKPLTNADGSVVTQTVVAAVTGDITPSGTGSMNVPDANSTAGQALVNASTVAQRINDAYHTVTVANNDTQVTASNGSTQISAGDNVTYAAGKNLVASISNADTANPTVTYGLAEDISLNNVTASNFIGITNGPSLSTSGVDAGGKVISNVAPGVKGTDAVNVNQLNAVNDRVGKVDRKLRSGIAGVAAAAGLPQVYIPGKSMMSASAGTYRGESAIAVGYSTASDNGKVILKLTGSGNSRGDVTGSVGVGYQW